MKKLVLLFIVLIVAVNAQNYHPQYIEGMKAFKSGKYVEAEDLFSKALADDFFDAELYYMRGLARLYQNRFDEAVSDFSEAVNLDPKHADAYNSRGLCYGYMNQNVAALPDFNKAIELDPKLSQAYINRASLYITNKEYDKAKNDIAKALKIDNTNPELYMQRGRLYHLTGEYEKAIKDFSTVIRKGVKHNKIYYNRANSYFKLNEYEKAVKDYSEALKYDPNDNESLNNRAIAYSKLGLNDLAKRDREILNKRLNIYFQPFEDITFRKFESSNGEVALELPDNWHLYEKQAQTGFMVMISKDSLDPSKEMMSSGVTITVERDMFNRYNLMNDESVLEFWKGSQNMNSKEYATYNVKSKSEKLFHGYPSILNNTIIQTDPRYIEFQMYEYVIAYRGNLVFIYLQAPNKEFDYYNEIFLHAIKSFELSPDKAK